MSNEAFDNAKPARRRNPAKPPARRPDTGERRPLQKAGAWTREHWAATRERLAAARLKKPSKQTMQKAGVALAILAVVIAVLIAIWDWNWFRGPVARYASAKMNREVTISGDLKVRPWSWRPSAEVDGIRIANPAWAGAQPLAEIDRLAVRIRLIPLFIGRVDLQLLRFDRPNVRLYADAQGRKNWDFSDGRKRDEPMRLPPIRRFIIEDGQLRYTDVKRNLRFSGEINARERLGARNRGFQMTGDGSLNREPFSLQVTGGPLLNIERDKPYPFDVDIRAGQTVVTAKGAIPEPFDLGRFYMNATARGQDLGHLYGLTGIALPNTPPYDLRGRLSRDGKLFRIDDLGGKVGDSDLNGDISVQTGLERPLLKGSLNSRSLDFDDLGALFGGAPSTAPGETASADQKVVARQLNAQQRLLPDTTLNVEKIRGIDADVTYKAVSIRDAPVKLRAGSVRVRLDAGLLRADPLELDLPQGKIAGKVQLDARKATPVTDLDLRLTNARIEQLIPVQAGGAQPLTGGLTGRAHLVGTGNSVHKAFASADGEVMVVVPGGEIREAFAELMGVNVTRGLGLLLAKNQDKTPIRCAVAHFKATDGVLNAQNIVFDTGPVLGTGSGQINMGTERISFRLQGKPKDFRLVRLMAPITISGPITRPKLGVEPGKAIAQGGIAVALGTLVTPLAALLPFVDPGLAKDANCGALIAEAGRQGAPTSVAAR